MSLKQDFRLCALVSNVYLLLDYGNFTDGRASNTSSPYVQLLSTTYPAEAHSDFVATRLNGKDTTGSGEKSFFQRHRIPIIAAAVVVCAVALAGAVWLVARWHKHMYHTLPYPAPVVDMPIVHVAGYSAGLQAPYYPDRWSRWR